MVFAARQGGVENELESYLDSRTVGSGAGRNFVFRLGMGTMPKTVLHACEEFTGMLRESRRYENWVTGTEKKLRKTVQNFTMGRKLHR